MVRYHGSRLKIIRRLGTPIPGLMRTKPNLKKFYGPGQHGPTKRSKLSDFALRLREKQKLCYHYGINEKHLRRYISYAFKQKINPGLTLLLVLELRLDNVIFRAGFAQSILATKQMISHGHIVVNNHKVDISSYKLKIGDLISLSSRSKMVNQVTIFQKSLSHFVLPSYIKIKDNNSLMLEIISNPIRNDVPLNINEWLVVEYYAGK